MAIPDSVQLEWRELAQKTPEGRDTQHGSTSGQKPTARRSVDQHSWVGSGFGGEKLQTASHPLKVIRFNQRQTHSALVAFALYCADGSASFAEKLLPTIQNTDLV